ncbi:PHD finger protein 21A-like isoform X2 [Coccinella septempunctata]|nr:PHD finger protein 21A-like isoform X2 [Coccinella septempunctata]XP_044748931.1 PHD finger protein 21A-like isoform X2 [Coccinella septempunctata]XP_044748932.1 PHD finger protein 21A-like isoform X2 [Coccinella septempunctata]XP_044748933.1 PHD finger protein 21A-like isoform X2 [Coccinella septempunctata]
MKLEVTKELRDSVEENQISLKKAIILHQTIYHKFLEDQKNEELRKNLVVAEQEVLKCGLEQKILLQKLRTELSIQAKLSQKNSSKSILEEKKQQLSSNLVRSRKQKIAPKVSPKASCSDESNEDSANSPTPKFVHADTPELLAQIEFLKLFSLTTLENFKEMQNKRVERKRRTTANPNFIYENDLPSKRRKNNYPSSISPPNTRQAVKKKNGRGSPPAEKPEDRKLSKRASSESIPEMVSENTNESDELSNYICKNCKSDGALLQCELCLEGFHENCDEPSVLGSSKRCSHCTDKKKSKKKPDSLEQATSSEKIVEKQKLQDQNENLSAQLTQLQDRHSQLTISLKNQKVRQEELLSDRQNTEGKIKCILNFIEAVKKSPMADLAPH